MHVFLKGFWMHFGRDLGAKMEEKSIRKRCQKHVGCDLEVEPAKTQKMPPLKAFLVFFLIKLGPKSLKIKEKSMPPPLLLYQKSIKINEHQRKSKTNQSKNR